MFNRPELLVPPAADQLSEKGDSFERQSEKPVTGVEGQVDQVRPEDLKQLQGRQDLILSDEPFDIYLAGKHFQIISVKDNPRFRVSHLFTDPASFDLAQGDKGFKGLREGRPVVIGRSSPDAQRFDLPQTISREHLLVLIEKGKLILEDLNSTHGTFVRKNRFEPSNEIGNIFEDFRSYVMRHPEELAAAEAEGSIALQDYIYQSFYNKHGDDLKYKPEDPATTQLVATYNSAPVLRALQNEVLDTSGPAKFLPFSRGEGWVYADTNGGVAKQERGRLYLNLKPQEVLRCYPQLVHALAEAGLKTQIKMPEKMTADMANRSDKVVIYFNASEEAQVLELLEKIYPDFESAFDDTATPRFTCPVKDSRGQDFKGITFGQSSDFIRASFGDLRARILAEVQLAAGKQGLTVNDPRFAFNEAWHQACLRAMVDPDDPAFDLDSQNKNLFSLIKSRNRITRAAIKTAPARAA